MVKKADLHVHTYYSDGTFSPEDVVKSAVKRGLAAVAICDHDCTDAIKEAKAIAQKYALEIVPGVEITAEIEGIEVHLLGYFIDVDAESIVSLLKNLRESRVGRIYSMIERLKEHHVDITPAEVFSLSTKGTIGRLHLATALYNARKVSTMKEAFIKYLADDAPCYVARFCVSPEEAISAILRSGGVPVYAHPGAMGRDDFIPRFLKAGLRGLEVYHADHNRGKREYYSGLAEKYGLLATGGSDSHGDYKGKIGGTTIPYSLVEGLKKESENIQKEFPASRNG
ncbi:MAG: PHP domain-containing protein [Candidatus Omnitrophota bacterium]